MFPQFASGPACTAASPRGVSRSAEGVHAAQRSRPDREPGGDRGDVERDNQSAGAHGGDGRAGGGCARRHPIFAARGRASCTGARGSEKQEFAADIRDNVVSQKNIDWGLKLTLTRGRKCRGKRAGGGCGWGGAVCAAPWPRSAGCARGSRRNAGPLLRACARCRPAGRSAS